jgi:hypothetical protein
MHSFVKASLGMTEGTTPDGINIVWQTPNSILTQLRVTPNNPHNRISHISVADAGFIRQNEVDLIKAKLLDINTGIEIRKNLPASAFFDKIQVFISRDKPHGMWKTTNRGSDRIIFALGVHVTAELNNLHQIYTMAVGGDLTKQFVPHVTLVMLENVPHTQTKKIMDEFIRYSISSASQWYEYDMFRGRECKFSSGRRINDVVYSV